MLKAVAQFSNHLSSLASIKVLKLSLDLLHHHPHKASTRSRIQSVLHHLLFLKLSSFLSLHLLLSTISNHSHLRVLLLTSNGRVHRQKGHSSNNPKDLLNDRLSTRPMDLQKDQLSIIKTTSGININKILVSLSPTVVNLSPRYLNTNNISLLGHRDRRNTIC